MLQLWCTVFRPATSNNVRYTFSNRETPFFLPGCQTTPKVQSRRVKKHPVPCKWGKECQNSLHDNLHIFRHSCNQCKSSSIKSRLDSSHERNRARVALLRQQLAAVQLAARTVVRRPINNYNSDLRAPLKFLDTYGQFRMPLPPTQKDICLRRTVCASMLT